MKHTLQKHERVKRDLHLQRIFSKGDSFIAYPIRVSYVLEKASADDQGIKMGVGVSKRNFKKAVDRNGIKRRIREAYRQQNFTLRSQVNDQDCFLLIFLLFIGKEIPEYALLHRQVAYALQRISNQLALTK